VAFSKNKKIQGVKFCASPALPGTSGLLTTGYMLLEKKNLTVKRTCLGSKINAKKGKMWGGVRVIFCQTLIAAYQATDETTRLAMCCEGVML
jgi:hypothetical protein